MRWLLLVLLVNSASAQTILIARDKARRCASDAVLMQSLLAEAETHRDVRVFTAAVDKATSSDRRALKLAAAAWENRNKKGSAVRHFDICLSN